MAISSFMLDSEMLSSNKQQEGRDFDLFSVPLYSLNPASAWNWANKQKKKKKMLQ